jgi:hypothetical protein
MQLNPSSSFQNVSRITVSHVIPATPNSCIIILIAILQSIIVIRYFCQSILVVDIMWNLSCILIPERLAVYLYSVHAEDGSLNQPKNFRHAAEGC